MSGADGRGAGPGPRAVPERAERAERCERCGTVLARRGVAPLLAVPLAVGAAAVGLVLLSGESLTTVELLLAVTAMFALLIVSLGPLTRRWLATPPCPKCAGRGAG